jgi:aryl-alcohol dehydrogenase-like predicted oxidoreductase
LVAEQSLYNLSARTIELEVIPACRAYGLGLIPWSPLAGGMLGGMAAKIKGGRRTDEDTIKEYQQAKKQIDTWEALCKKLGEQPGDVALAWLLANPAVTAPIIGPRTLEQLTGSLRALKIRLKSATLKELDQLFPGPGGEAPEAYAW